MFVKGIEVAGQFTRPILTIYRNYDSTEVHPGAATLFMVNAEGWALTCGHVARHLMASDEICAKYDAFKRERDALANDKRKKQLLHELERKYKYSKGQTVELRNRFLNCIEGLKGCDIRIHPEFDLALIRFNGFSKLLVNRFPAFPADCSGLRQGKYLCRLGFPFPEFQNFAYNPSKDCIEWTDAGKPSTPQFPIEGMVTRQLLSAKGAVCGFELSTPGLRGQSGGPAFDCDGVVWGMQAQTAHLDLDFDVSQDVLRGGTKKHVTDSAFLHVGHCIHADVMKAFMTQHDVKFEVA